MKQPFTLAPLPYPANALAPQIGAETVLIHHGRHQAGYVNKLNAALADCPQYACWPLERLLCASQALPASIRTEVCRNAGGVFAHELYFDCMTPCPTQAAPGGALGEAIDRCFGSFAQFRACFLARAAAIFGSGWCWLCRDHCGRLQILTTQNQQTPLTFGLYPLLVVDVWEHAYYLDRQNFRDQYLENWWTLIDWAFVQKSDDAIFCKKRG